MSSPLDSTPANSVVSQQTYDSEEYALDKINSADEALAIIHDSGFFNQSVYSFVVLTSVDHDIAIDLLKLIDAKRSERIVLPEESFNTENAKLYPRSPACVVCPTADPLAHLLNMQACMFDRLSSLWMKFGGEGI